MGIGLQKTLVFILLIAVGVVLKRKINSPAEIRGIKILILSIALPATIFIALLKIEIKPSLLYLPLAAFGINFLLLLGSWIFQKIQGVSTESKEYRTLLLLMPSLAPGLSCFPFLMEYFGEESLGLAALADVGNKVFVLIILYLLAMHWYYRLLAKADKDAISSNGRLKELGMAMLREPINMVLFIAISMLAFGLNLSSLPAFLQDSITRMSLLMTPMVLIFIGLAVRVKREDLLMIAQILFWRSGFAFLISGFLLFFIPSHLSALLVLVLMFPQSACSFWPFAHMTAIKAMEDGKTEKRTFDVELGLNLLAFSLPFSTLIMLSISSFHAVFLNPLVVLTLAGLFLGIAIIPALRKAIRKWKSISIQPLQVEQEMVPNAVHE